MTAWTVIPAGWQKVVSCLSEQLPSVREDLQADVQHFMQARINSGLLAPAWQHSLLGYNGSPLEFTLSSAKPAAIAATFDPLLPVPQASRSLSAFRQHYARWAGECPSSQQRFAEVEQWQPPVAALRFGSWIGRKYAATATQTKVYSELPETGAFSATSWLTPYTGLTPLMVGYYPSQPESAVEYYLLWRNDTFDLRTLLAIMQHFGCSSAMQQNLQTLLQQALGPSDEAFPPTTYGVSLVIQDQQLTSFTLFTMAPRFCSASATVPAWLDAFQQRSGLCLPVLNGLILAEVPLQFNVLGFSVDSQGTPAINCTFSPQIDRFVSQPVSRSSSRLAQSGIPSLLQKNQAPSGAFLSQVLTPDGQWQQDENGFVTAQVLRTLEHNHLTAPYIDRALDFLERCETVPHRFSFWPTDAHPAWMQGERITPDVDDTALITEVLYRYGRRTPLQLQQTLLGINNYQLTKVDPRLKPRQHQWAQVRALLTWMRDDQPISQLDCCVNTNVLILMHCFIQTGGNTFPGYTQILNMLARAINWAGEDYDRLNLLIPYYAHPHEWQVTLEYARQCGIADLDALILALKQWQPPSSHSALPLYRRHDGQYLWISDSLAAFRQLALHHHSEERYERLSY
ncbi:hypothetical protein [Pantoea sp. A4]|uniref:hypothetical protein n=1 Tax=Pantoea sp. A4 TaxID=1225184 RepID=UPI00037AF36A|nr:hypothetical protein [Pantoea sp. A4]